MAMTGKRAWIGTWIVLTAVAASLLIFPKPAYGEGDPLSASEFSPVGTVEARSDILMTSHLERKAAKAEKVRDKAVFLAGRGYLAKAQRKVKALKQLHRSAKGLLAKIDPEGGYFAKAQRKVLRIKALKEDGQVELRSARRLDKLRKGAASRLRTNGVVYSQGWRYTYYSQKVLPGHGLSIPGRHVGTAGLVVDGENRVCVASSSHQRGTVLETIFGKAKVYDTGCPYGTLDIYVNW